MTLLRDYLRQKYAQPSDRRHRGVRRDAVRVPAGGPNALCGRPDHLHRLRSCRRGGRTLDARRRLASSSSVSTAGRSRRCEPFTPIPNRSSWSRASPIMVARPGRTSSARNWPAFEHDLTITYLTDLPTSALVDTLSHAPPTSLVLYVRHAEDSSERALDPIEAASLLARVSRVPMYSIARAYFGQGIVGGYLADHEVVGAQAGQLALRVLAGERPRISNATNATLTPMFDWRAIERWNINPARLPSGSDIRFRVPHRLGSIPRLHRRRDHTVGLPGIDDHRARRPAFAAPQGRGAQCGDSQRRTGHDVPADQGWRVYRLPRPRPGRSRW